MTYIVYWKWILSDVSFKKAKHPHDSPIPILFESYPLLENKNKTQQKTTWLQNFTLE